MDLLPYLKLSTLKVNEGSSKMGVHMDPTAPLPALVAGPGLCVPDPLTGELKPTGAGGRLFLADGLVDISYGPRDVVIFDGNIPHGITNLRDLPGAGQASRAELTRFSAIMFADFARERGQKQYGNFSSAWRAEWRNKVLWKWERRVV